MIRRTKIVATLGPVSNSETMITNLIKTGVNVFRLNFSHGTAEQHKQSAEQIRAASALLDTSVAILADLQGPKIRIARFKTGETQLENGAKFVLDAGMDEAAGDDHCVGLGYKDLPNDCDAGDVLLLNDGLIELEVESVENNKIHCIVLVGGLLSNNKGVNRRGGGLTAKALTDKDKQDIIHAANMDVDYLALSFPRDAEDVNQARSLYQQAGR